MKNHEKTIKKIINTLLARITAHGLNLYPRTVSKNQIG